MNWKNKWVLAELHLGKNQSTCPWLSAKKPRELPCPHPSNAEGNTKPVLIGKKALVFDYALADDSHMIVDC